MIVKLANRNIIGNGWRSLINMVILSIVIVGMAWMWAMFYSWINLSKQRMQEWEHGKGMLWVKSYDPFDSFSLDKSYAPITPAQEAAIGAGEILPILMSPAVAYPQGRMMSTLVKGIPADQTLLEIPSNYLIQGDEGYLIPAIVGSTLAKTFRLSEGDLVTIRIKDINGVYDALDVSIVHIMQSPVPTVDSQAFWVDLEALQRLKNMPGMATQFVLSHPAQGELASEEWRYVSLDELLADLNAVMKTELSAQSSMFGTLVLLAMLAIFDTQVLSLFKRRKEIGTLAALGMTQKQIIGLFTVEGILYMLYASVLSFIIGLPIFIYFGVKGWSLPSEYADYGIVGFTEPLYFKYNVGMFVAIFLIMLGFTALASWLPSLRISKMKPTDALRGIVR